MLALKQFKKTAKGLADYLNWGSVIAPGIVLNKDGSLLIGRYFRGSNLDHDPASAWAIASDAANRALCKLRGGWALWIDDVRLPVSKYLDPALSHFPCPVAQMVEDERRADLTKDGACLESEYAVILHYMPPPRHAGRLVNLIYDKDPDSTESPASAVLDVFTAAVAEFDDQLSVVLQMRPMPDVTWMDESDRPQRSCELVNYLHFTVTGELIDIALPDHACYLDGIIGEVAVDPGFFPKIGENFTAAIAISGYPYPSGSRSGVLARLDNLPFPLRWSTRYIVLDPGEAEKQGQRIENKWKQKARGWKGLLFKDALPNEDGTEMAQDAAAAIRRTQSGVEGTGYYTSVVIVQHHDMDVLQARVKRVRDEIKVARYPTRLETINAMEAVLGTFPGHCIPNVRRPPVHTTNLADLMPLGAPWQGLEHNPCPMYPPNSPPLIQAVTAGSTPINIVLHSGDLPHTLIFGPSGSGKSTLLNTISMQALRYKNAVVWAFDKGRALLPTFRAIGKYFDIGDGDLAFCPLSVLDYDSDMFWAEEWVASCCLLNGLDLKPRHTFAIHEAMLLLRASKRRSITDFNSACQDKEVREAMEYYTVKGSLGHLTDAEHDGLADALVVGFEIGELMGMGVKAVVPIMTYLFRRFAKALKGSPAYLLIDEAWTMLGHSSFVGKIKEWLKELRKANAAVVMATQSLSDAVHSGLIDVLMENCLTRIYGANGAAQQEGTEEEPGPKAFYQMMGLNEPQIELIKQAKPKRQYLYTMPEGSALIDLRLGPKTLRFAGRGSKTDLARVNYLYATYGEQWTGHWLREGGLHHPGITTEMADAA